VDICPLRLKFRSGCGSHLDSFRQSADLECSIHANHVVLVHQNVRGHKGTESRPRNLNPVRAWDHRRDSVATNIVRYNGARIVRLNEGDFDGGARHAPTARVGNVTYY